MNIHGFSYKLGKNKEENWKILDEADETDLFFHLSSFPSGYLILKRGKEVPSNKILNIASFICKYNTKQKNMKNIKVDCTSCRNVRKTKNIGEVEYKSNRKVYQIMI